MCTNMACTNIYPVFVKFKKYKHVIFPGGDSSHVTKEDYASFNYADLNEKIRKDIVNLIGAADRATGKYIVINETNGRKLDVKK